jgi:hypothetical protein
MLTRDVGDGRGPQPCSFAEASAEIQLLGEAGYCHIEIGDDEESQAFAADVRRLNPDWQPGEIPKVPAGYPDGRALCAPVATRPVGRVQVAARAPRRGSVRSVRSGRSRARAPDDSEPSPEPVAIPLEVFHLELNRVLGERLCAQRWTEGGSEADVPADLVAPDGDTAAEGCDRPAGDSGREQRLGAG